MQEAENQYKEALAKVLEDGRIEKWERGHLEALQKKLGISAEKADRLENEMRNPGFDPEALTIIEERKYQDAFAAFYEECKDKEALEIIEPLYDRHPLNEKILLLYLPVVAADDEKKAMKIIDSLKVDLLSAVITSVDIAIKNKKFDDAERILRGGSRAWSSNPLFNCYRALFYFAMYKHLSESSFLDKVKEIAGSLPETSEDKITMSYITKIQVMIAIEDSGDKNLGAEFIKEFCRQNGLYWRVFLEKSGLSEDFVLIDCGDMDPFYISKYEVTQELYEAVTGENPSEFKGDKRPVEMVSWYDAIRFCNMLSGIYDRTPVYSVNGNVDVEAWNYKAHDGDSIEGEIKMNENADGYRLPTKEEWWT